MRSLSTVKQGGPNLVENHSAPQPRIEVQQVEFLVVNHFQNV